MKAALIRLIVLIVLLINQFLITFGWDALPFSEDQIYSAISSVATVAMAVYTWWKNNSVTKEAQQADKHMKNLKEKKQKTRE